MADATSAGATGRGDDIRDVRLPGLDGIRTLAVLMVVWHNYGPLPGLTRFPAVSSLRAGYVGVTAFFVLSGFLITHLLTDEFGRGGIRIGAFYVRRAVRLLPALLLTLTLLTAINADRGISWAQTIGALAAALFYVYNFALAAADLSQPLGGGTWSHLWSLSVEEQFYIVWPVVLGVALRRIRPRALAPTILVAALAVTGWRTALWLSGASDHRLYLWTDVRIDAILLGCALAIARRQYPQVRALARRCSGLLLPSVVGLVVMARFGSREWAFDSPGWTLGPGMVVAALLSAVVVWLVVEAPTNVTGRVMQSRPLEWIGRRSYGIYLLHPVAEAIVTDHLRGGWVAAFVLTFVMAALSYRFVEQPILRRTPSWARRGAEASPAPAGSMSG